MPASKPLGSATLFAGYAGDTHSRMHGRSLEGRENVKAWGAVGDGVTNDKPAIQAAVDSGARIIYYPPGDYFLADGESIIVGYGQRHIGSGWGYSHTSTISSKNAYAFREDPAQGFSTVGLQIRSLNTTLRAGSVSGGGVKLVLTGSFGHSNCVIKDCNFAGTSTSDDPVLWLDQQINNLISACAIVNGGGHGILINANAIGSNINRIQHCQIDQNSSKEPDWALRSGAGIKALGGQDLQILNNCIQGNGYAIDITNTSNSLVDGNYFEFQLNDNIRLFGCTNAKILNNSFRGTGAAVNQRYIHLMNGGNNGNTLIMGNRFMDSPVDSTKAMFIGTDSYYTTLLGNSNIQDGVNYFDAGTGTIFLSGDGNHTQKWGDGVNLKLGSTTGTKIGTATTQKLGFFNTTPVVQPAANADTSGATLGQLETEVNQLKAALRSLGIIAT